jgi:hypothetical protein
MSVAKSAQIKLAPEMAPVNEPQTARSEFERILTGEEADNLVAEVFAECPAGTDEADQVARALLKVVDILAYEPDETVRSNAANNFSKAIYAKTRDFADKMDQFALAAGCRFDSDQFDKVAEDAA